MRCVRLAFVLLLACSRKEPAPEPAPKPAPPAKSAAQAVSERRYSPPDLAAGERRPALLFLHGLGSSGRIAFEALGLQELAARERFHLVAPDGTLDSRGRRFWNAHPACCDFDGQGVDDVARLGALLDGLAAEPGVDSRRMYVVGFSNGGFMAHRLACERADRIAAVASIAGVGPAPDLACKASDIAVLEIHGDADEIVRHEGGHLFGRPELPRHASAAETFRGWGKRLSCPSEPSRGPALDLDPRLPGAETETSTFDGCSSGSAALWTVRGGEHAIGFHRGFHQQVWRYLSQYEKPSRG